MGPPPSGHHQSAAPCRSLRHPPSQLQPGRNAGRRVAMAQGLKAALVGADCCLIVLFKAAVPRLGHRRLLGGGKWCLGGMGGGLTDEQEAKVSQGDAPAGLYGGSRVFSFHRRFCYFLRVDFFLKDQITEHARKKKRAAGRSHLQLGSSAPPGRPAFPPLHTRRLHDPSLSLSPLHTHPPRHSASRALLFSPRTHPSLHLSSLRRAAGSMAKRIIQQQSTSLPSASLLPHSSLPSGPRRRCGGVGRSVWGG